MKKIITTIREIIKRFSFSRLRNETHVEFNTTVDALIIKYNPETLQIEDRYAVYKPLLAEEITALDVIRRSELTKEIERLDHERDSLWRGMESTVQANLHHWDPGKRQAAEKLETIMEHYGNMARKTLDDETAAIEDLHRELMKQENYNYVVALGLGDWLGQMVQTSRNLEALMANRNAELLQRPTVKMQPIRKEVDAALNSIIDLLEALVEINGPDTNKNFIIELNGLMERYKDILAQEAGRRHPIKDLGAGDHTVIEPIETQKYTERPVTPVPEVHFREEGKETKRLYLGNDFEVTYKNNTNVGMAELTIHGKGNYKGEKTVTFNIAR